MERSFSQVCRRIGTVWLAIAIVVTTASVSLVPRVNAQTISTDSVGEAFTFVFVSYFVFTLLATECVEARLYRDLAIQSSFQYPCAGAGATAFDFLSAEIDSGTYTLELYSYLTNGPIYTRSWDLPSLTLDAAVVPTSGTTGESFGAQATFRIAPGGPDAYVRRGTLTVDGDETFSMPMTVELYTPADLAFFGITPTSNYETYAATLPISFGSPGTRTVIVRYADSLHALSGSMSVSVSDPVGANVTELQSELAALRDELSTSRDQVAQLQSGLAAARSALDGAAFVSYAAIAAGLVGALFGAYAILTVRRMRRPMAPTSAPPPPGSPPREPGPPFEPPL